MVNVIKKVEAPPSLLAELDWESGGYLIRYRIVSDSRNIRSHWSPVYFVPVPDFTDVEGQFSESISDSDPTKSVVSVVWDDVFNRPSYDVFVSFRDNPPEDTFEYDGDDFYYHGTTATHEYAFVQRDGVSSIRIIVQPSANKKLIKSNFVIYDSDNPIATES
jgi:hypothetical protein